MRFLWGIVTDLLRSVRSGTKGTSNGSQITTGAKEAITDSTSIADSHMVAIDFESAVVATDDCVTTTTTGRSRYQQRDEAVSGPVSGRPGYLLANSQATD